MLYFYIVFICNLDKLIFSNSILIYFDYIINKKRLTLHIEQCKLIFFLMSLVKIIYCLSIFSSTFIIIRAIIPPIKAVSSCGKLRAAFIGGLTVKK